MFGKHPRSKNKGLLLDIIIVMSYASSNLKNAARDARKHFADAVELKTTSIGARSLLPTPSFLSLGRRVVGLAQACMPS